MLDSGRSKKYIYISSMGLAGQPGRDRGWPWNGQPPLPRTVGRLHGCTVGRASGRARGWLVAGYSSVKMVTTDRSKIWMVTKKANGNKGIRRGRASCNGGAIEEKITLLRVIPTMTFETMTWWGSTACWRRFCLKLLSRTLQALQHPQNENNS